MCELLRGGSCERTTKEICIVSVYTVKVQLKGLTHSGANTSPESIKTGQSH